MLALPTQPLQHASTSTTPHVSPQHSPDFSQRPKTGGCLGFHLLPEVPDLLPCSLGNSRQPLNPTSHQPGFQKRQPEATPAHRQRGCGRTTEPFSPHLRLNKNISGRSWGGLWVANTLRYLGAGALPKGCVRTTTLNWCEGGQICLLATFPVGKVPALLSLRVCFAPTCSQHTGTVVGGSCLPAASPADRPLWHPSKNVRVYTHKPLLLSFYCFSLSKLAFLVSSPPPSACYFQPFPINFIQICWIPFSRQCCKELFSSPQSREGGNQS